MEQGGARDTAAERPSPGAPAAVRYGAAPGPAGAGPAADRVPEQRPGAAPAAERARGEHTHSEPAAPPVPGGAGPFGGPAAPVRRHSVRGQILDALRDALVGGELVPGEIYSAPALGERFGVSATPVREAMQQLALEGAVQVVPNRGFRVTERGAGELAELAEVRALIEVPVLLRLARTVTAEQWAALRPLAKATEVAAAVGDRAGYAESDRAFHRAVLALAGNQQLVMVADDLHRRSQWPLRGALLPRRADLAADAAEHTALLDALIARDRAAVQSLARDHFTGTAG
ncbi:GntR family transcriptional regulator [Streptomyces paludis]|uniref:GntR family transcriptional regulator n=1 Tax=Streptomyces paludis TaxID=2282738 RepID=A0A345HWG6_9ACTN|nr:GntR family transcriptional regulator [Streptomyces paludis]AXG81040.1 GntR family transcriptional regulator [Streptomyces paludis]